MPTPGTSAVLGSEDCLYLNVTAPTPKPAGQKRPVLVWMHGGAFLGGSGSDYSAEQLAVRGDTVVVTVNYRLGIFGYFGHPGLGSAPPFGLADQQAALRWVRANAERFGGDPRSVTLFGESAGALSICAHLTSPTAVGLFQRAVLQSGSCLMSFPRGALGPGTPAYEPFASQRDVQTAGAEAARQLGCPADGGAEVLACLRGQSTDRLATAQLMQSFNRPAFGNTLLPVAPAQALASGRFHRVPVILGTNHDEMRMFVGLTLAAFPIRTESDYRARLVDAFGLAAPAVEAQYPAAHHPTPALAWATVLTDRSLACTTLAAGRAIAADAPGLPSTATNSAIRMLLSSPVYRRTRASLRCGARLRDAVPVLLPPHRATADRRPARPVGPDGRLLDELRAHRQPERLRRTALASPPPFVTSRAVGAVVGSRSRRNPPRRCVFRTPLLVLGPPASVSLCAYRGRTAPAQKSIGPVSHRAARVSSADSTPGPRRAQFAAACALSVPSVVPPPISCDMHGCGPAAVPPANHEFRIHAGGELAGTRPWVNGTSEPNTCILKAALPDQVRPRGVPPSRPPCDSLHPCRTLWSAAPADPA